MSLNKSKLRCIIYRLSWLDKKQKATRNPIIKKDKWLEYNVKITLSYEEIKKDPQRITKIKPFINKYTWEGINFPSEKDDWKKIQKNNRTIALLMFFMLKTKKYTMLMFKNMTQIVENQSFFNDSKWRRMTLSCSEKNCQHHLEKWSLNTQ